jgi:hypothetical protein
MIGVAAIFSPPISTSPQAVCETTVISYIIAFWSSSTLLTWCLVAILFLYLSRRKACDTKTHKYQKIWRNRLNWLVKNSQRLIPSFAVGDVSAKSRMLLVDVAKELADYFIDIDLTPTDIAAGLILVYLKFNLQVKRKQKLEAERLLEERVESVLAVQEYESNSAAALKGAMDLLAVPSSATSPDTTLHPDEGPVDDIPLEREDIPDILHFANYMSIMYNVNPEKSEFLGEILANSKENDVYQSPYLVAVDEEWKTVVIAIRGTFSIADLLVDLRVEMVE